MFDPRDLSDSRQAGSGRSPAGGAAGEGAPTRREREAAIRAGSASTSASASSGRWPMWACIGAVAYRDLSEAHFGGHPYTTRRGVDRMVRSGRVVRTPGRRAEGRNLYGAHAHRTRSAGSAGTRRQIWHGCRATHPRRDRQARRTLPRHRHLSGRAGRERPHCRGGRPRPPGPHRRGTQKPRSRQATEKARAEKGDRAADAARFRMAEELGLPVKDGKVLYPDAQLEYDDAEGRTGRCNIEVATEHYRAGEIAAKAAAGFQMHGNGPRAARAIGRALGRDRDSGRGGGGVGRDPASIEL